MTNEKAIEILDTIPLLDYDGEVKPDWIIAIDMAIKALEQTDVLDKIRAEIANYGAIWVEYIIPGHTDRDIEKIVENVLREAKEQVLGIIDKYKVESEG